MEEGLESDKYDINRWSEENSIFSLSQPQLRTLKHMRGRFSQMAHRKQPFSPSSITEEGPETTLGFSGLLLA
jgi:hypothetical protein